MPALEALQARLYESNTVPLGVSVDSVHCHANWGQSLGGVSFPLLADFHPKGEMAQRYGVYLESSGITDRATVLVDADGIVQHASSVTPAGKRDIGEIATLCEENARRYGNALPVATPATGLSKDAVLYVKDSCGFSRAALLACSNLHLEDTLVVRNVSQDAAAKEALVDLSGKEQAPALVEGERVIQDSKEIISYLASRCLPS